MTREGLWQFICQRTVLFERGLRVVAENLDLGTGDLGTVDGLLRDAAGGAVLVFATDESDAVLPARVFAAYSFWQRNRESLPRALPEAELRGPCGCRRLVVGARLSPEVVQALQRLGVEGLDVIEIEPFQVAGRERLAMRRLLVDGDAFGSSDGEADVGLELGDPQEPDDPAGDSLGLTHGVLHATLDDALGDSDRLVFAEMARLLTRLDPQIRIDGDRFSRRALFRGVSLCEYRYADDRVQGSVPGQAPTQLGGRVDVRAFGDQVMRRYLELRGESRAPNGAAADESRSGPELRGSSPRKPLDVLRASVSQQRLSSEEHQALDEPVTEEDPD